MNLERLKELGEAPEFLTDEGYKTLLGGYLLKDETPLGMYKRVARSAATYLNKPEMESKFFDYMWRNWICPSSPIVGNAGTSKGLTISCYGIDTPDSTIGIFNKYTETAMLTKFGGGIGKYWGNIRGRGSPISRGGLSEGVIPWLKTEESIIQSVAQSGMRRGASANYLPIEHPDAEEFIDIRRKTGDLNRRCLSKSFHHAVTISDNFMNAAKDGDVNSRKRWEQLLRTRIERGEPYITFIDNANRKLPQAYINNNLKVKTSQLCNEIYLFNDELNTFVCCLMSMNLARYHEWKNTDAVETAIWLLDAMMSEFISKAKQLDGFESAIRFSEKSRALGLGVLGWHTLLQSSLIPFDSFDAMQLNAEVFKLIEEKSQKASRDLAVIYGEPEWCRGTGMRNTHLQAVAPTVSNSLISGGVSQGVEPIVTNYYVQKSAKGAFVRKNPTLQKLLSDLGKDTIETWEKINEHGGSVRSLDFLSDHEKAVFETAREINQFAIVRQAGQRQKWIDQGQSINLFYCKPENINDPEMRRKLGKYVHDVHMEAWELGLKGLYYCRSESTVKGDVVFKDAEACKACEG